MKVKEVIEELQKLNPEIECLMAINKSPGFENADIIDYYPIEDVFGKTLMKEERTGLDGRATVKIMILLKRQLFMFTLNSLWKE